MFIFEENLFPSEKDNENKTNSQAIVSYMKKIIHVTALLDTGASITCISHDLAKNLNLIATSETTVKSFQKRISKVPKYESDTNLLFIEYQHHIISLKKVIIADNDHEIILGRDAKAQIDQSIEDENKCKEMVRKNFPNNISRDRFDLGQCSIKAPPIIFKSLEMESFKRYDLPKDVENKMMHDVNKLIEMNIIEPGIADYILNSLGKTYCSAKPSYFLQHLNQFTHISSIDLTQAYMQILISDQDFNKVGFHLGSRLYIVKRLMFGMHSSPGIWQSIIDEILKNTIAISYQDDIIVATTGTIEHHLHELHNTMVALSQNNLKINLDKSSFGRKSINYLGFHITPRGISIQQKFIDFLNNIKQPQSIHDLRSFRGIVGFLRNHIEGLAPLEDEMNTFIGGTSKQNGKHKISIPSSVLSKIEVIKDKIRHAPLLHHIDLKLPFLIFCDASEFGFGSLLAQPCKPLTDYTTVQQDQVVPIAFHSRSIRNHRRLIPAVLLELMCIADCLVNFKELLYNRCLYIFTDHRNLQKIIKESTDPRYRKYIFTILTFTPEDIIFIPGHKNTIPDYLSRCGSPSPSPIQEEEENLIIEEKNDNKENIANKLFIQVYIKNNHLSLKKIFFRVKEYLIKNIKKEKKIRQIMAILRKKLNDCEVCRLNNDTRRKKINKNNERFLNLEPFQEISLDCTFINNNTIVVAIDHASGYVIAKIIPDQSINSIKSFLQQRIFYIFGLPNRIHLDNFKTFTSKKFLKEMEDFNTRITFADPDSHSTNPLVERMNRTIKLAVRKTENWRKKFEQIIFNINHSEYEDLNISPHDVVFAYKVKKFNANIEESNRQLFAGELKQIANIIRHLPKEIIMKNRKQYPNSSSNRNKLVKINEESLDTDTITRSLQTHTVFCFPWSNSFFIKKKEVFNTFYNNKNLNESQPNQSTPLLPCAPIADTADAPPAAAPAPTSSLPPTGFQLFIPKRGGFN
uniref:RNA-directed DNA polymerase n=1 Tax=Strongyloides stercoralis TaxID=6248 RepID=A0A0K0DTT4_STRER